MPMKMNDNGMTTGTENRPGIMALSPHMPLLVLLCLFFIGVFLTSLLVMLIGSENRIQLLFGAVVQDILAFIAPTIITGWLVLRKPAVWCGLKKTVSPLMVCGVVCVYVVSIGALNAIVVLNESMTLPHWLSGLEEVMRNLEDQAAATTKLLLGDTSLGGLLSGILIVGVFGPVAEEIFFRGGLQRSLYGKNPVKAIWWSALIFSLLHFQMYGFVPRFLLGLWFGYLYYWTGSLWPSIIAHTLNNSVTVLGQWLVARGSIEEWVLNIGGDFSPMIVGTSLVLTIIAIYGCKVIKPEINPLKRPV